MGSSLAELVSVFDPGGRTGAVRDSNAPMVQQGWELFVRKECENLRTAAAVVGQKQTQAQWDPSPVVPRSYAMKQKKGEYRKGTPRSSTHRPLDQASFLQEISSAGLLSPDFFSA
jgi:hypothetical protein